MKKVLFAFLFSMAFAFVANASSAVPITATSLVKKVKTKLDIKTIKTLYLSNGATIDVEQFCSCWSIQIYVNGKVVGTMSGCGCAISEKAFYNILDITANG